MIVKHVGVFQIVANSGLDPRRNDNSGVVRGLTNVSIASDILTLYHKSLVHSSVVIFDAAKINPSNLSLVGNGALLFELMELSKTGIDACEKDVIEFLTQSN